MVAKIEITQSEDFWSIHLHGNTPLLGDYDLTPVSKEEVKSVEKCALCNKEFLVRGVAAVAKMGFNIEYDSTVVIFDNEQRQRRCTKKFASNKCLPITDICVECCKALKQIGLVRIVTNYKEKD